MAATDPQDDTLTLAGTPNTTIGAPLPASPNVPAAALAPAQISQTDASMAHAMDRADLGNRFGFGSQQYLQGTENPAPATPQFATSTNDIINSAIENRMAAIARGTDPDHPALYVSPQRSVELQKEFHALGETRNRNALVDASLADKRLQTQLHTASANDFTNYANGVSNIISSGLKPGTPEFQQAFLQNYLKFRDGATTKSGKELTQLFAQKHDNHAVTTENIQQALKSYKDATGLEPENVEVTATGGVNIRGKSTDNTPDNKTTTKLAPIDQQARTEAIKAFTNSKTGATIEDWKNPIEVVGVNSKGEQNDVKPEDRTHIKITGPSGKSAVLTNSQFDVLKQTWGVPAPAKNDVTAATPAASVTPSATPAANTYHVGGKYGSLIYKGGDPKVQSSWEPAK